MILLECLWWVGWAYVAAWAALPLLLLPQVGPFAGFVLWCALAPWSVLLGIAAVQPFVPRVEPGRYRMFSDPGSVRWAIRGWAPAVFLTVCQPVFFMSRVYQRLALRALGARLGRGACVTSKTVIREPHLVSLGANAMVGEFVHLVCSYQHPPGLLRVGRVVVGDGVLVGAHSILGPGTHIGARSVLEYEVRVEPGVTIGEDVRIGAQSVLRRGARIGNGARIGKGCVVPEHAVVPDGAVLCDRTGQEACA
jgi:acetyltransferase-like isoleucine patch superfamily enzyme